MDIILDNTEDAEIRLIHLLSYYDQCVMDQVDVKEVFSTIGFTYLLSSSTHIKSFIKLVSTCDRLPIEHRIALVRDLKIEDSFDFLSEVYDKCKDTINQRLPIQIREDTILFFCNPLLNTKYETQYQTIMLEFVSDKDIEPITRYRFIKKLQFKGETKKSKKETPTEKEENQRIGLIYQEKLLIPALNQFISDEGIPINFRLLSAQFLYSIGCESRVKDFLYRIGSDPTQSEDIRADSYDILLKYTTSTEEKDSIRNLIKILGGNSRSLYGNSQNVHSSSIEKSVEQLINRLSVRIPIEREIEFSKVKAFILKQFKHEFRGCDKEDVERVQLDLELSLQRVEVDEAVYGVQNIRLQSILCKLYTFIQESPYTSELMDRLIEELLESQNKCSSGFVSRLVNVLSGYHQDMTLMISFEEEITSKIENELNKQIQALSGTDLIRITHPTMDGEHKVEEITIDEYRDLIIEEMAVDNKKYRERKHFLHFFRSRFTQIRTGLYQEYKGLITDEEFDRYTTKAVILYEG